MDKFTNLDDIRSRIEELENADADDETSVEYDELKVLQAFVSETDYQFEPMVDHLLEQNDGDFDAVTKWLSSNDFSVYEDWEAYVTDFLDNNYDELPPLIRNNLDLDAIGNELSMSETWEEIGGCVIIFY